MEGGEGVKNKINTKTELDKFEVWKGQSVPAELGAVQRVVKKLVLLDF